VETPIHKEFKKKAIIKGRARSPNREVPLDIKKAFGLRLTPLDIVRAVKLKENRRTENTRRLYKKGQQ
jgi:hypothetical protein